MKRKATGILFKTEMVLVGIFLFFALELILTLDILPHFGIHIYSDIHGVSMHPTIIDGAFEVGVHSPYEELKVGDIIIFQERLEYKLASKPFLSNVTKGKYPESEDSSLEKPDSDTADTSPTDSSAPEAAPDEEIKYTDETITHRIIEINNGEIRTRGDNNDIDDRFPVTEENYIAKVVWWNNYLGWPFRIMYEYHGFYWLLGIISVLGVVAIVLKLRENENTGE